VGIGPTTLRDLVDYGQGFVWPEPVGFPFDQGEYDLATTVVGGVGDREANDAELKAMFSDSIDKYASFRSNFLQNRQGEIEVLKARDGEEPKGSEFADPLADPDPEAKVQDPAEPATVNQPEIPPDAAPEPVTP
jgi:phospholipid-binding lipoprotein MlaA